MEDLGVRVDLWLVQGTKIMEQTKNCLSYYNIKMPLDYGYFLQCFRAWDFRLAQWLMLWPAKMQPQFDPGYWRMGWYVVIRKSRCFFL